MRLALPFFLVFSSCTAAKAFVVTGEAIDQVGQQFIIVSNAMQTGLQSGRVSKEEFLQWAAFSARFDAFYGRGVDALKAARAIRDDVAARDLEAAIGRLAIELSGHYAAVKQAGLLSRGAP